MLDWIIEAFFPVVIWIVLLPALWVTSTPVILVVALFRPGAYLAAVAGMYSALTQFWADCAPGIFFL